MDVFSGVCLFLSVLVRMITSERLNLERSSLAVRYIVQKSRPSLKVNVKGQRSRSPLRKKRKTAESSPFTMHSRACAEARPYEQAATDDTIAWPPGGDGLRRRGKISACCLDIYKQTSPHNRESTSMVWPTLGSRTAKEQNRTVSS